MANEPNQGTNVPATPGREGPTDANGGRARPSFWRRGPVIVVGTVVLGILLFFGLVYLVESFTHESTDDAFLDADIVWVAPRVAGQVTNVFIRNNQRVSKGAPLLEVDPRDLNVQVEQKRAAVESAKANVELIKASVELFRTQIATAEATAKQSVAEAAAAQATAERATADLKRAQDLIQNHTISPQEFDTAQATASAAQASLKAAQEKAASDQSKVAQAQAQLEAGRRGYERALAQTRQSEWDVQAAELNLSYTRLNAESEGYVTRKAVEPGDYVQVGQRVLALVPSWIGTNGIYVTANFKETQLQKLRPGQPVRISIDSIAEGPFPGHIESIMAGSGARFSLLPPENAVGNYVKVVQRVPVKIVFDGNVKSEHVLGPGMSVVPSIHAASFEISEPVVRVAAVLLALILGAFWWTLARRRTLKRER